jgi:hypothetical protein
MNVKNVMGGWGRTKVQSPRSNVQSRRKPTGVPYNRPCRAVSGVAQVTFEIKWGVEGWTSEMELENGAKPLKRLCDARRLYTALKCGVNESGVCESYDNHENYTLSFSVFGRDGLTRSWSLSPRGLLASPRLVSPPPRRPRSHESQDLQCDFLEVRRNAGFRGNMKVCTIVAIVALISIAGRSGVEGRTVKGSTFKMICKSLTR